MLAPGFPVVARLDGDVNAVVAFSIAACGRDVEEKLTAGDHTEHMLTALCG